MDRKYCVIVLSLIALLLSTGQVFLWGQDIDFSKYDTPQEQEQNDLDFSKYETKPVAKVTPDIATTVKEPTTTKQQTPETQAPTTQEPDFAKYDNSSKTANVTGQTQQETSSANGEESGSVNVLDALDKWGSGTLQYFNPQLLYFKMKNAFKSKPAAVPAATQPVTPATQPITPATQPVKSVPTDIKASRDVKAIEKEILAQTEKSLDFMADLEKLDTTVEPMPGDDEIKVLPLPDEPVATDKTVPSTDLKVGESRQLLSQDQTIQAQIGLQAQQEVSEEPEELPSERLFRFSFIQEAIYLPPDNDSLVNRDNLLELPKFLQRSVLRVIFEYQLYQDQANEFHINVYAKNSYVYSDPSFPDHSQNYLQEAYANLHYQRFDLAVGKMNVQSGDGALAWNPTDYFDFGSTVSSPRDGNSERKGHRPGFFAVQAGYRFDFGTLMVLYSPDLTDHGDVYENTEFNNNRENVYYSRFSWILFDPVNRYAFIGPLGHSLDAVDPEFSVCYFDRQKLFNVGVNWSVGYGTALLFKVEANYATKTLTDELRDAPLLFGERDFEFKRRSGPNWEVVLALSYTPAKFNINFQYYFQSNGQSRSEVDGMFERMQFLNDNLSHPFLAERYLGLLRQASGQFNPAMARHYIVCNMEYTFHIASKRQLSPSLFHLWSITDYSGSIGCGLKYQALSFVNLDASFTTSYGQSQTLFGEKFTQYLFAAAATINF